MTLARTGYQTDLNPLARFCQDAPTLSPPPRQNEEGAGGEECEAADCETPPPTRWLGPGRASLIRSNLGSAMAKLPLGAACRGKTVAPDVTSQAHTLRPTKRLPIPDPRGTELQRQRRGIFVDHPTIIESLAP